MSQSDRGMEAFRWTEATGMLGLGDLDGGLFSSEPLAVSGDGSVIVGSSVVGPSEEDRIAFIWNAEHGMQRLSDVLIEEGVDLANWSLTEATSISADGTIIAGNGSGGAWIATLTHQVNPVESIAEPIQPGDANLDGKFDSKDLILAFSRHKYGTGESATWKDGDWNGAPNSGFLLADQFGPQGDGLFNSQDLVAAMQTGLYESGPYYLNSNESLRFVPEPDFPEWRMLAVLVCMYCSKRTLRIA
ncbi:MAG: hypothetical protein R3C28_26325 [Pirellulaceae bacterium]